MYEKCIKCDRLGKDCIPNLYVMSITEIREWARKLKEEKGWSNAHLAEVSGVPKGTIDSNFSKRNGKCADVNYSTFSPILCALIGCRNDEMICNNLFIESSQSCEKIGELEAENDKLRKTIDEMNTKTELQNKKYEEYVGSLKEDIKWKQKIIIVLIVISCTLVSFILIGLVIDWMNSGIGFFWL